MHIEESVKLDFKDVLIRPKRSTLTSRSGVDIHREFTFHHSRRRTRTVCATMPADCGSSWSAPAAPG
jgi:GMP reductase